MFVYPPYAVRFYSCPPWLQEGAVHIESQPECAAKNVHIESHHPGTAPPVDSYELRNVGLEEIETQSPEDQAKKLEGRRVSFDVRKASYLSRDSVHNELLKWYDTCVIRTMTCSIHTNAYIYINIHTNNNIGSVAPRNALVGVFISPPQANSSILSTSS